MSTEVSSQKLQWSDSQTYTDKAFHQCRQTAMIVECTAGFGWSIYANGGRSPFFADQAALCDYLEALLNRVCTDCGRELRRTEGDGVCSDCHEKGSTEEVMLEEHREAECEAGR